LKASLTSLLREGNVLSPILFDAMMDKSTNKFKGQSIRPKKEILICEDNVLIYGKTKKKLKIN
jgi:hypothetical protein